MSFYLTAYTFFVDLSKRTTRLYLLIITSMLYIPYFFLALGFSFLIPELGGIRGLILEVSKIIQISIYLVWFIVFLEGITIVFDLSVSVTKYLRNKRGTQ